MASGERAKDRTGSEVLGDGEPDGNQYREEVHWRS